MNDSNSNSRIDDLFASMKQKKTSTLYPPRPAPPPAADPLERVTPPDPGPIDAAAIPMRQDDGSAYQQALAAQQRLDAWKGQQDDYLRDQLHHPAAVSAYSTPSNSWLYASGTAQEVAQQADTYQREHLTGNAGDAGQDPASRLLPDTGTLLMMAAGAAVFALFLFF